MKTSAALVIVKQNVSTGYVGDTLSSYICIAAEMTQWNGLITDPALRKIKKHISNMLGEHATLSRWLESTHDIKSVRPGSRKHIEHYRKMQVTRHTWLDHMIEEFKSKGD